ncbi:MAG: cytochrome c5 family protein [Betaproteobacteria bacterium]|nr:MAG: cytochrome c5 family protein [Betaproteobacteria bacterium]
MGIFVIARGIGLSLCAPQIAAAADGKEVYDKSCATCHAKGIGGALKLTEKDKWAPLVKQGPDALTATVIKGKGIMPPRAGSPSLSDADIKAAVDYMIQQVK